MRASELGDDGGWVLKSKLKSKTKGHRDDEKDNELRLLRDELREHGHPDLNDNERVALVRTSPLRDGTVRLAVPAANIRFDSSLANFELIGDRTTGRIKDTTRQGSVDHANQMAIASAITKTLLAAARSLGVPSPQEAA